MTVPYLIRLVCLGFASFFLLHLAIGMVVAGLGPVALRLAGRMEPRRAARFVIAIRLFPPTAAILVVAVFCVPSYIWLEPRITAEGIGLACLAAAILGASVWGVSILRSARAIISSARFMRDCQRSASRTNLPGEVSPVWVIEKEPPLVVALAGVIRPQLIVSRRVLNALSREQLELALRHERAHRMSHDNLKRLALLLAPDVIPFINPWGRLEKSWAMFAEWSADDAAAAGDIHRSLSLAAALVSIARTGSRAYPSPLAASLVGSAADLAARVERLLVPAPPSAKVERHISSLAAAWGIATCTTMVLALQPSVLSFVHEVLEHLIA